MKMLYRFNTISMINLTNSETAVTDGLDNVMNLVSRSITS